MSPATSTMRGPNRRKAQRMLDPEVILAADRVLIAIGFAGAQVAPLGAPAPLGPCDTIDTDTSMMAALPGMFAAGDARRGQLLVVWGIAEDRQAVRQIDVHLSGSSTLSASLLTANPPLGRGSIEA